MEQNLIWTGGKSSSWVDLSAVINKEYTKYWKAGEDRKRKRRVPDLQTMICHWMPPAPGYLKLNFDAAYRDGTTVTGVILRDSSGDIKGAWVHRFESANAFCAETEAANQALHITTTLNLPQVLIEGDAATVVMALNGIDDYTDWQINTSYYCRPFDTVPTLSLATTICSQGMQSQRTQFSTIGLKLLTFVVELSHPFSHLLFGVIVGGLNLHTFVCFASC